MKTYVNLQANPALQNLERDWKVKVFSHERGARRVMVELVNDELRLDGRKVILEFSKEQKAGESISGADLLKRFSIDRLININLRNFLLKNPRLIPRYWRIKPEGRYVGCGRDISIHFLGTVLCLEANESGKSLAGISLDPRSMCWEPCTSSLDSSWCKTDPIACFEG